MRKGLSPNMDMMTIMLEMSEGNPGAISVLSKIAKLGIAGFGYFLDLDDMNIRGTQIWIGFTEYCESDIDKFCKALEDRDPKMVGIINGFQKSGNHSEIAVVHGASYRR